MFPKNDDLHSFASFADKTFEAFAELAALVLGLAGVLVFAFAFGAMSLAEKFGRFTQNRFALDLGP